MPERDHGSQGHDGTVRFPFPAVLGTELVLGKDLTAWTAWSLTGSVAGGGQNPKPMAEQGGGGGTAQFLKVRQAAGPGEGAEPAHSDTAIRVHSPTEGGGLRR